MATHPISLSPRRHCLNYRIRLWGRAAALIFDGVNQQRQDVISSNEGNGDVFCPRQLQRRVNGSCGVSLCAHWALFVCLFSLVVSCEQLSLQNLYIDFL